MDGTAAISSNLEALKRILAGLVSMAGLGNRQSAIASRQSASEQAADGQAAPDCLLPTANCRMTLPRHLRLAILRQLRPAEAAARRLIIASARGLLVPLPAPRKPSPKPATMEPQLRRFGIAVVMSPADLASAARILPRLRGRGTGEAGGGGGSATAGPYSEVRAIGVPKSTFPLFDPPRRLRLSPARRTIPAHAAPRILFPGSTVGRHPELRAQRASKDDPVDATRLSQRLSALAAALEDMPGQARRFARWKARHDAQREARGPGRIKRIWPLRPGRPPGGRLSRFDPSAIRRRNTREIDEILAHAHALAIYALRYPDTS